MLSLPPVLRELSSLVRLCLARARQTSSTGAAFVCFQEGQSSCLVCLLVTRQEVCDHEVPLVMSPVMQATESRIVFTWVWSAQTLRLKL